MYILSNNLISELFSYIFPIRIEKVYSPINGQIIVEKYCASLRISVGGYWQSGKYAEKLMDKALKALPGKKDGVNNILLLGLAGGSFIKVLRQYYPDSEITAVDLDPVIVSLGKKYFCLDRIKNLNIKISEAAKFVNKEKAEKYDLVVMDIFIGCDTPGSVETEGYINNLYRILKKDGVLIVNRSNLSEYQMNTEKFVNKVKKRFQNVRLLTIHPNILIIAYKQK